MDLPSALDSALGDVDHSDMVDDEQDKRGGGFDD